MCFLPNDCATIEIPKDGDLPKIKPQSKEPILLSFRKKQILRVN